nr:reverse transcriptase domain-containing protein [Tanacetum cinerariifolium]
MSTYSSARNLFPPLDNLELTIRRRSRANPTLLNDFKMATEGNGDPPVSDLWTIKELCQPSLNGRGGTMAPIAIQATNFGLKNNTIQQVQNSCQFHGLPGDDANKHLGKFLHVTQTIKENGVTDNALRLYLFPHSLTHHATTWFDRLPRNSINTFEQMAKIFLVKYFPPSMVMKLRNESPTFVNVPMNTFYNGLTLRHRDTINAAAGGTFMKMPLKAEMAEINKNLMRVLQVNHQVRAVTPSHTMIVQPPLAKPRTYMPREPIKVANDAILKNMQTNMTSLTNFNLELKNMFDQFMKMNTVSSSGSGTLRSNTITNPKEDLKGITIQSGTAYQGPRIPTTSSSFPKIVKRETEMLSSSCPNALFLMPKFGPSIKSLLTNKDKLFELARTPLNEHCSAVLPKKLPEKLRDPDKFLIPCDFLGMDECLALADLGASINLMPLSVWNKLSLPELTSTLMTLELADRALIDVFEGELTLLVGREAITFNLDQTSRYSANYNDMTANRIDVIDMACEEYSQEVLGFSNVIANGNPTPYYDPIVSTSFLTLTPFGVSNFLLEEVDAFLALEDDATSPKVDHSYYDPEGDTLLLKSFLNDDPSLPPPNQGIYLPQVRKELKICEAKNDKSSIDEHPEVELKDLPPHLEYAFLEGDVGNKMHKAFPLPGESSHWQYKFPLP